MRFREGLGDWELVPAKADIAQWLLGHVRTSESDYRIIGAELGVKAGVHAAHLLEHEPQLHLHCVDAWTAWPDSAEYRKCGDPAGNASQEQYDKWEADARWLLDEWPDRQTIWKMTTNEAAVVVPDGLDLVYIDADHTYQNRLSDIGQWYAKVRPGGVIAGGLLVSSFGGDCGRRALWDFIEQSGIYAAVEFGPSRTWMFKRK